MSLTYLLFKFIQILFIFFYKIEFFNGFGKAIPVQIVQLSQTPQPTSGFLIASQNTAMGKQLLALPACQSTCLPPQTGKSLKLPAGLFALSPILPVPPELGCAPTNPCPIQSSVDNNSAVFDIKRARRNCCCCCQPCCCCCQPCCCGCCGGGGGGCCCCRPCCCGCGLNICVRPSCCCRCCPTCTGCTGYGCRRRRRRNVI
ncbi:hypothetical protein ACQ4LE_009201 [Meloidogyne hapla]|uniref:IGFBP N-terminal domain-containing protein n=1 Tax=Meloidogyne hapla TaxID=6305 RepID=A0A1I8BP97_MELHA